MQLVQTFIADEWEETGEMGFRPDECSEAFNPLSEGFGLAHDFIEHAGNFTVEGEIMAHAAMFHVRYETGHMVGRASRPLSLSDFGYEWINLYHGINAEGCLDRCTEPQERLDERMEEDLAEIISHGKRMIISEVGRDFLDLAIYTALSQDFANWFRKGYREAEERFSSIPCRVTAFETVREMFNELLRRDELYPGQTVTVTLDLETGNVNFEEEELDYCEY